MATNIHPIPLSVDNCYLLQDEGTVLIDGGAPGRIDAFERALEDLAIDPREIHLILLTHAHWDHIAQARELKELTGARIALHRREKGCLEKPASPPPMPPGVTTWGRILARLMGVYTRSLKIPAAEVDLVLGDEGLNLAVYGIPGKVIYTPGHSPGSVSVLLETGEAFVGDLAMSMPPLRFSPGLPIFAEDIEQVKQNCRLLLDRGAKTIYPAHGRPFAAEILRSAVM